MKMLSMLSAVLISPAVGGLAGAATITNATTAMGSIGGGVVGGLGGVELDGDVEISRGVCVKRLGEIIKQNTPKRYNISPGIHGIDFEIYQKVQGIKAICRIPEYILCLCIPFFGWDCSRDVFRNYLASMRFGGMCHIYTPDAIPLIEKIKQEYITKYNCNPFLKIVLNYDPNEVGHDRR